MSTRGARTFFSVQIAEIESPCARTCVFLSLFERVANIYIEIAEGDRIEVLKVCFLLVTL